MGRISKCVSVVLVLCLLVGLLGCNKQAETTPATQGAAVTEAPTAPAPTVAETAPEETVPEETVPEETEPEKIEEPVAQYIDEGVLITLDGTNITAKITETSYTLPRTVYYSQELAVESEKPFGALYIEWSVMPEKFSLVWDGGSLDCGAEGFLHDYIRLPEEVNSLSFVFEGDGACSIQQMGVYTYGVAPEGVQDWLPPCETADILVFPTHADDDVLFFGAVISYYAIEKGLAVQTAFMTDHRNEPYRKHERLDGLWAMGVRHYPILGEARDYYTESLQEATIFHKNDNILQWQVELIRRFKPQVILGHDLNGEYGHGQHKLNAHCLIEAVELAADAEQFPEIAAQYGLWDTPKLYLHLYEENQIVFDVNTVLNNDPEGRTPFEITEEAYQCHVSQQQYYFAVTQDPESPLDCTRFGLYRTLVGYDTGADLMEHTARDE